MITGAEHHHPEREPDSHSKGVTRRGVLRDLGEKSGRKPGSERDRAPSTHARIGTPCIAAEETRCEDGYFI
ncbi:hypothetical protein SCOR_09460 [Sulfidibacter corallicola]